MRTIAVLLVVLTGSMLFASGDSEDDFPGYGPGYRGSFRGDFRDESRGYWDADEFPDAEVVTGVFSLEDGRYPALATPDGKLYYLRICFPVANEDIPVNGSEMTVEALPSLASPNLLMVFSAEVNGQTIQSAWRDFRGPRGGYRGSRGFGGRRGRVNRGLFSDRRWDQP